MLPHPAALLGLLIAAVPSTCPPLPTLGTLVCTADAAGFTYGRDEAAVRTMTEDVEVARELYRTYFGRLPPLGAVVSAGTQHAVGAKEERRLRSAGAHWVLPWIDAADRNRALEPKIREAITQKMSGMPQEAIDAEVARALASATGGEAGADTSMRSALRHELGHKWLIVDRWPRFDEEEAAKRTDSHYGGPAPDWLDETAAVLMEDATMTERRRELFGAIRRGGEPGERIVALAEFVTMDHPLAARLRALPDAKPDAKSGAKPDAKSGAKSGSSVRIISGEEGRQLAAGARAFYSQARVFADYLIARGGRPDVFASIADAAADGQDFASWLGRHGAEYGLPVTLPALERDWLDWLVPAYPPSA